MLTCSQVVGQNKEQSKPCGGHNHAKPIGNENIICTAPATTYVQCHGNAFDAPESIGMTLDNVNFDRESMFFSSVISEFSSGNGRFVMRGTS